MSEPSSEREQDGSSGKQMYLIGHNLAEAQVLLRKTRDILTCLGSRPLHAMTMSPSVLNLSINVQASKKTAGIFSTGKLKPVARPEYCIFPIFIS